MTMDRKARTLLIVEDDPDYNEQFKEYCEAVLNEIAQELAIQGTIEQAYSYDSAQKVLNSGRKVDFISLDLALNKGEPSASGMRLLRELRAKNSRTIAIIVSGESNIAYPIEALQKHGAMVYFFKAADIEDRYEHAIMAALRYLEVEDRVLELEQQTDPEPAVLQAIEEQWQKVLVDTAKAGIDNRQLPNDLEPRIEALRNKLFDLNTQLPIGKLLVNNLAKRVFNKVERWSLIHVRVGNFSIINTSYPSMIKPLLSTIASILRDIAKQYQETDPFIGFLYQYQTIGPSFFIALEEADNDAAREMCNQIDKEFADRAKSHLPNMEIRSSARERAKKVLQESQYQSLSERARAEKERELTKQFGLEVVAILLPKLDIDVFSSQDSYFGDINELIDELANPRA
jgi:ActR/RegA family two-component response regulator